MRVPASPELNSALDILQGLAIDGTKEQRELHPKRKPVWAPALAFSEELVIALRPFFGDCDVTFGRLWPVFSWEQKGWWDQKRPVRNFNLKAGLLPNAFSIISVGKSFKEGWEINAFDSRLGAERNGPDPKMAIRNLGISELIKFAESPETVMRAGARVSGICCMCFKKLTDPLSRQRGIGPECFKKVRVDESILPAVIEVA